MRRGFTLVELLVVLVLMGLAIGLVAPALRPPEAPSESALAPLLRAGRSAAIRRGEPTLLTVERDGRWQLAGRASPGDLLADGRIAAPRARFSVVFSPLGTCAPDVASGAAEALPIEMLDCGMRAP